MTYRITSAVSLIIFTSCVPLGNLPVSDSEDKGASQSISKRLEYADKNYENYVGNVIVNSTNPMVKLGSAQPIDLEFDLLSNTFENLQARWVHCNFDWKPSQLREIEYLPGFNRFDHKSFDYSSNTKTPYIQYFFELDRPKVSGNYVLVLYRRNNPDDLLFSRRMVFYESQIDIEAEMIMPRSVKNRRTHQQLDFSINYSAIESPNPQRDFRTVLLRNKDWETAVVDLKANNVLPTSFKLEWNYFTGETEFAGWNQFRWLDLRTFVVRGNGVAKIERGEKRLDVYQSIDSDHGSNTYRQLINDNNGRYIPGNSDPGEPWLEADYAFVHFTLMSEINVGDVYVTGRFNEWRRNERNKMKYQPEVGAYEATIRLKQGYYDYRYEVASGSFEPYHFEGSHFQTENEYDILIYFRAPGRINDRIIGYRQLNSADYF